MDAVVPVHNAPELVRRCLESVLAHVGHRLGTLVAVDDASDAPTVAMLASLDHPKLRVLRTDRNLGYGGAVNLGVASCRAPLVLQLNSDVEAREDFLSPLVAALEADAELAGLNPGGNSYRRYDLPRYAKRAGCVVTNHLAGYAFLIRRSVFAELGGFDPVFGRGYFEDSDLTRRILRAGHWVGMHPGTSLHHESHGSFSKQPERRALLEANRVVYHQRWPEARRNVLIASRATRASELPPRMLERAWAVLEGGGSIWWVSPESPSDLLSLGMRGERIGIIRGLRRFRRQRRDPWKRMTELWIMSDAPRLPVALLRLASRSAGIEPEVWPAP
ncbi:MAG: glycosyltransferase [Myxococcota bacterium]